MYRVKGDCLQLMGKEQEAVLEFERAANLAAENSARLFELRALNRLVRLIPTPDYRDRLGAFVAGLAGDPPTTEFKEALELLHRS